MPSDGANCPQEFIDEWKGYAKKYKSEFRCINNSKVNASDEKKKLLGSNILVISGGDTFKLLYNLRKSGLDKTIKDFSNKDEFVLAGFSAGALVLTPTIELCNLQLSGWELNSMGIKDFTGLGIVNFEIFPHYLDSSHKEILKKYRIRSENEVKEITNDDYIVIDL